MVAIINEAEYCNLCIPSSYLLPRVVGRESGRHVVAGAQKWHKFQTRSPRKVMIVLYVNVEVFWRAARTLGIKYLFNNLLA